MLLFLRQLFMMRVCVCVCVHACVRACVRVRVCVCVVIVHWHCSAQLSMFNMEKRYRNKIIIIIIIMLSHVFLICAKHLIVILLLTQQRQTSYCSENYCFSQIFPLSHYYKNLIVLPLLLQLQQQFWCPFTKTSAGTEKLSLCRSYFTCHRQIITLFSKLHLGQKTIALFFLLHLGLNNYCPVIPTLAGTDKSLPCPSCSTWGTEMIALSFLL